MGQLDPHFYTWSLEALRLSTPSLDQPHLLPLSMTFLTKAAGFQQLSVKYRFIFPNSDEPRAFFKYTVLWSVSTYVYTFYYGKVQTNKSSVMKPSYNAYQCTAYIILSIFHILLDCFEADLKNIILSPWWFLTELLAKSWPLWVFSRNCCDISQM